MGTFLGPADAASFRNPVQHADRHALLEPARHRRLRGALADRQYPTASLMKSVVGTIGDPYFRAAALSEFISTEIREPDRLARIEPHHEKVAARSVRESLARRRLLARGIAAVAARLRTDGIFRLPSASASARFSGRLLNVPRFHSACAGRPGQSPQFMSTRPAPGRRSPAIPAEFIAYLLFILSAIGDQADPRAAGSSPAPRASSRLARSAPRKRDQLCVRRLTTSEVVEMPPHPKRERLGETAAMTKTPSARARRTRSDEPPIARLPVPAAAHGIEA